MLFVIFTPGLSHLNPRLSRLTSSQTHIVSSHQLEITLRHLHPCCQYPRQMTPLAACWPSSPQKPSPIPPPPPSPPPSHPSISSISVLLHDVVRLSWQGFLWSLCSLCRHALPVTWRPPMDYPEKGTKLNFIISLSFSVAALQKVSCVSKEKRKVRAETTELRY